MAYTTKKTLLQQIKSGNDGAWYEFYLVYTPLVKFCGRKRGISEDDLEDLVQMVMVRFHKAQENFNYDQSRGHFRSYLGRVINSAIDDLLKLRGATAGELSEDVADAQDWVANLTDEEWRNYLQENALPLLRQRVSPTTYQAFELYVLKGKSPQLVAQFLDMEVTQVYNAKARCQRMLQEIVQTLEG